MGKKGKKAAKNESTSKQSVNPDGHEKKAEKEEGVQCSEVSSSSNQPGKTGKKKSKKSKKANKRTMPEDKHNVGAPTKMAKIEDGEGKVTKKKIKFGDDGSFQEVQVKEEWTSELQLEQRSKSIVRLKPGDHWYDLLRTKEVSSFATKK